MFYLESKLLIFIQNSLGFVAWGPTENKSALVQIMAWQWSGDKPVPSPMLPMLYYAIYDCGLMTQLETYIWVNIASGNGMLPDGTKPSPEPMLTNPSWGLLVPEGNFAQISILAMSLKIATPRLQPHFPRVNELRCHSYKEIFHFFYP